MVVSTFAGCIKKGTAAEKPAHVSYLTDFLYYCTDTGELYWDNGSVWVLLQGPTKTETLQNKIINLANNTVTGVQTDPFATALREGYISPSLSAAASLRGALKGLPANGTTYSYFFDTTEGYVSRFSTSIVENLGYYSSTTPFISRREWATHLKVKCKVSSTSNTRLYIGFTSNLTLPSTNTPLGNTDHGIIVGFNTANTNYTVTTNDGAGVANSQSFGAVAKDTTFRTFDILMSDTNIVCSLDGANTQTLSTKLPGLTTDMYLNIQLQNTTAAAKTFDISKGLFQSDFV